VRSKLDVEETQNHEPEGLPPFPEGITPKKGPEVGGTVVTITGRHLGVSKKDIIAVTIADIPCEDVQYRSQEEIQCTTGPKEGGGRGEVIVETKSGGVSSNGLIFWYTYPPEVTTATPDNGPVDGGTDVLINGTQFGESADELLSVKLAGIECKKFHWINGGHIRCVSAPSTKEKPRRGPIEVITLDGGSGTNRTMKKLTVKHKADIVMWEYNRAPYVARVMPNNGSYVGGTNITVQGFDLGKNLDDLISIMVAGVPCTNFTAKDDYYGISYTCLTGHVPEDARSPMNPIVGPVIVTTRSGGIGNKLPRHNALYTYNPPPFLMDVSPNYSFASTPTLLKIQGKWLGQYPADVAEVNIAGRPCQLMYKTNSWIDCYTPVINMALEGPIEVHTISGGIGHSNFTFKFVPQCELFGNSEVCSSNGCHWCYSSMSCVDDAQECPSSCFLHPSKDSCNAFGDDPTHPCLWCSSTTSCLEYSRKIYGGQTTITSDCPSSCSLWPSVEFSCGSLIILILWILLILVVAAGFWLIIYFVNRDEQFAASIKKLATRLHPRLVRQQKQQVVDEEDQAETRNTSKDPLFPKQDIRDNSVEEQEPLLKGGSPVAPFASTRRTEPTNEKKPSPGNNLLNFSGHLSKIRSSFSQVVENENYKRLSGQDDDAIPKGIYSSYTNEEMVDIAEKKKTSWNIASNSSNP
ncbi:hypothetical protein MP638_001571, partial [Amoeboaphelidium occidentale]